MTASLVNLDAEREVLAALMFHGREAWLRIARIVPLAAFFAASHQPTARVLIDLAERGLPAEPAHFREAALRLGDPSLADIATSLLGRLSEFLGGLPNLEYHAEIVADLAARRGMIAAANGLAVRAENRAISVQDLVKESVSELVAHSPGHRRTDATSDGLWDALQSLEADAALEGALPGISCGIPSLDHAMDGFCPGRLVVLAARPGCGKTGFALSCAQEAAGRQDAETYFVTLEQPVVQLRRRQIAMVGGWDVRDFTREKHRWASIAKQVAELTNTLSGQPLTFDAFPNTVTDISLAVQRHATSKAPVKLVIIDYLSWIRFEGRHDRHDLGIGHVTRSLATLAKDLHLCVLLLVQLNRESVRDGKARRPTLADLRDSGAIEQDADQVILLWEPPPPEDTPLISEAETTVEFFLAKNRHGPQASMRVDWSKATYRYAEQRHWRPVA